MIAASLTKLASLERRNKMRLAISSGVAARGLAASVDLKAS